MSPRSTLAQQWSQALTADETDTFTIWRRTGQAWNQVAGPFRWILSMVEESGAQRNQAPTFGLQATHRATVFDDGLAGLQDADRVFSVTRQRYYQVLRTEPGLATGGGILYLAEVKAG